jgi:hypothetical protein
MVGKEIKKYTRDPAFELSLIPVPLSTFTGLGVGEVSIEDDVEAGQSHHTFPVRTCVG